MYSELLFSHCLCRVYLSTGAELGEEEGVCGDISLLHLTVSSQIRDKTTPTDVFIGRLHCAQPEPAALGEMGAQ